MKVVKTKQIYPDSSYAVIYHKEGDRYHYHREDGPARTYYNKDGSISDEIWFIDNKRHREDGPAFIDYYKDGSIFSETWWINDKRHRKDGPAIIDYNEDGSVSSESWWINDKPLSEDQINNIKRNLAFNRWLEQELDRESS